MTIEESLKKLSRVTIGKSRLELLAAANMTPLAHAIEIIGRVSGFQLSSKSATKSSLDEISKIERLRYRSILLPTNWWSGDHGPLLSYYKGSPVTLLPEGGHYSLILPEEENPMTVTESIAADISIQAYTFYPPLPEEMGTVRALFHALFDHKMKDYLYLFLSGILATTVSLFVPISNKILFDNVIPHFNFSLLGQVLLGLLAAAAGSSAFLLSRSFISLRLNTKITHYFQMALWERILKLPVDFFRKMAKGDLIQRTMIFNALRRAVDQNSIIIIFDSLFASIYFFIALYYSWKLALVGLGAILLATSLTLFSISASMT